MPRLSASDTSLSRAYPAAKHSRASSYWPSRACVRPYVTKKLPLVTAVAQIAHRHQAGIEVRQRLCRTPLLFLGQSKVARDDALQAAVTELPRDTQRLFRHVDRLVEAALHQMQHAQIAQQRAFTAPIGKRARQLQRLLQAAARLVHATDVGVQHAEIAEQRALPAAVLDLPRPREPGLVGRARLVDAALVDGDVGQAVQGRTFGRAVTELPRQLQRLRQPIPRLGHPAVAAVQVGQLDHQVGLAGQVAPGSRAGERDLVVLARLRRVPQQLQRAALHRMRARRGRVVQTSQPAHRSREFSAAAEGSVTTEGGPGALQRADRALRFGFPDRPAAGCDEIGQIGAAGFDGALRTQGREPSAVPRLRAAQRRRAAAGEAALDRQMLRRIGLHADQQVEALLIDGAHERLVDQRLDHVDHPRRRGARRQIEHRLGRLAA